MYSSDWKRLISVFGYGFVNDLEQYKKILNLYAYRDMQPRTIKGLGKFNNDIHNRSKMKNFLNMIALDLYNFIVNEPKKDICEFDDWHHKECIKFVNGFKKTTGISINYGKAQKIINVSFKYIYCLKNSNQYSNKFTYCHMTLDSYTYYGNGKNSFYYSVVYKWATDINKKITKPSVCWSSLDYSLYIEIQNNIRDYINNTSYYIDKNRKKLTPFQAEFYIFDDFSSK